MSRTSALISVSSAAAMSFAIRLRLCVAQRLTYSARTVVGTGSKRRADASAPSDGVGRDGRGLGACSAVVLLARGVPGAFVPTVSAFGARALSTTVPAATWVFDV